MTEKTVNEIVQDINMFDYRPQHDTLTGFVNKIEEYVRNNSAAQIYLWDCTYLLKHGVECDDIGYFFEILSRYYKFKFMLAPRF